MASFSNISSLQSPANSPDQPALFPDQSVQQHQPPSPNSPPSSLQHQQQQQQPQPSTLRALLDHEKPQKRGSNLACLNCRAIKVRCSRAQEDDDRCKRCNRLNLICEFRQHHRGRKPKKRQKSQNHHSNSDQEHHQQSPDPELDSKNGKQAVHDPKYESDDSQDASLPPKRATPHAGTHFESSPTNPTTNIPIQTFARSDHVSQTEQPCHVVSSPTRHSLWYDDRFHASRRSWYGSAHQSSPKPEPVQRIYTLAANIRDDAIQHGVITVVEVRQLFDYYFQELNPPLALLDFHLHTVDYCRQHLPLLFSTIISVSSRFCRPDLYPRCQQIQTAVLALATVEEICSLDHIQALILAMTWKGSFDQTLTRKMVRAVGYAYELGIHIFNENISSQPETHNTESNLRHDSQTTLQPSMLQKRLLRDRQRTWIVLCLTQAVVQRVDRSLRPRDKLVPLQDHPDPLAWYLAGGDVTLTIDSRLGWSLDFTILTQETDQLVELASKSSEPSAFGSLFEAFHRKARVARSQWFEVAGDRFIPRYPMDKSAAAEIPYLDAYRKFSLLKATWHWALKVSCEQPTSTCHSLTQRLAKPQHWFSKTAEAANICLRLFITNLVKPGHLRVGHDYLVICASQAAKWLYVYHTALDPATIITANDYLHQIIKECSQPQRLPNGEITSIEREAPGYLVRFVEALLDAGFTEAVEKVKTSVMANRPMLPAESYSKNSDLRDPLPHHGRFRLSHEQAISEADDRAFDANRFSSRQTLSDAALVPSRRPTHFSLSSYRLDRLPAVMGSHSRASPGRYPAVKHETDIARSSLHSSAQSPPVSAAVSHDWNTTSVSAPLATLKHSPTSSVSSSATAPISFSAQSSHYQHIPPHSAQSSSSHHSNHSNAASFEHMQMLQPLQASHDKQQYWNSSVATFQHQEPHRTVQQSSDSLASGGQNMWATGTLLDSPTGRSMHITNLSPPTSDIGKISLESFVANLATHDITYWESILGTDLFTTG